jgi:hypothetical protein
MTLDWHWRRLLLERRCSRSQLMCVCSILLVPRYTNQTTCILLYLNVGLDIVVCSMAESHECTGFYQYPKKHGRCPCHSDMYSYIWLSSILLNIQIYVKIRFWNVYLFVRMYVKVFKTTASLSTNV